MRASQAAYDAKGFYQASATREKTAGASDLELLQRTFDRMK
jgi:hypothetical protein